MLTDKEIIKLVKKKNLIYPFNPESKSSIVIDGRKVSCPSYGLSHCGYDVVLQPIFKILETRGEPLDILKSPKEHLYREVNDVKAVIPPNGFLLGVTKERFNIPLDIVASLFCKSSLARLGLSLPPTIAEPGWSGELVVEIYNQTNSAITIYAGVGIGQMVFFKLKHNVRTGYANGKYQGQTGVQTTIYPNP